MPPRHVYWTILIGNAPTAFRAHDRADLLPTFERLRQKQPDVTMKYFARGRLWESAEEARNDAARSRSPEARGRDWRPGGSHRDPRDRFKPKKDKPPFDAERRARARDDRRSTELKGPKPRSAWTPKPKPFGKAKPFGSPKPFGTSRTPGDRKPFGDRKPSGGRSPSGDRTPWSADRGRLSGDRKRWSGDRKPFGDRKRFGDRNPLTAGNPRRDRRPGPERPGPKPPAEPPKEERLESGRKRGSRHAKKVRR
jgi:hypothetical protein